MSSTPHPITGQHTTPAPTVEVSDELRDAARVVGFVVATRHAATERLEALGATPITLTALRATAEAIAAQRTSWDDLPAQDWVVLANCLKALAKLPQLTPDERAAAGELREHYAERGAPRLDTTDENEL